MRETLEIYSTYVIISFHLLNTSSFNNTIKHHTTFFPHNSLHCLVSCPDWKFPSLTLIHLKSFVLLAAKLREACFDPGSVMNGTRLGSDYKMGSMVTFHCEAGYLLQGYSTLTCIMGNSKRPEWDRAKPICQGKPATHYFSLISYHQCRLYLSCCPYIDSVYRNVFELLFLHCVSQHIVVASHREEKQKDTFSMFEAPNCACCLGCWECQLTHIATDCH